MLWALRVIQRGLLFMCSLSPSVLLAKGRAAEFTGREKKES